MLLMMMSQKHTLLNIDSHFMIDPVRLLAVLAQV